MRERRKASTNTWRVSAVSDFGLLVASVYDETRRNEVGRSAAGWKTRHLKSLGLDRL